MRNTTIAAVDVVDLPAPAAAVALAHLERHGSGHPAAANYRDEFGRGPAGGLFTTPPAVSRIRGPRGRFASRRSELAGRLAA